MIVLKIYDLCVQTVTLKQKVTVDQKDLLKLFVV